MRALRSFKWLVRLFSNSKHVYIYIYIYIYTGRQRDRDRDRDTERDREVVLKLFCFEKFAGKHGVLH